MRLTASLDPAGFRSLISSLASTRSQWGSRTRRRQPPLGFYEFQRMPQGVKGTPATFQRLMETCMTGLNFLEVLVYMDDFIVFARSFDEMEERLFKVLDRLWDCGLKVSPEKCQFFCRSVKYLGHVVSEAGIQTDPEKVSAVVNWPKPTNER